MNQQLSDRQSGWHPVYQRLMLVAVVSMWTCCLSGCSTLASLGLPFGGSNNEILGSAKQISQSPGQSLLLPKELAKQPLEIYLLEIGDTILVEPVKFDASIRLPGDQIIKPDGRITLGEFGPYLAVGKSLEQAQLEIQSIIDGQLRLQLLEQFQLEKTQSGLGDESESLESSIPNSTESEPQVEQVDLERQQELQRRIDESLLQNRVSVRLVNWDSQRIYVLGEVNSPGSFNYLGNETVLDGIIEAGGLSAKANRHQIIVARPTNCSSCRVVMQVCYDQIVQLGDASTNYQLRPGDRVFVPSLTFCDDLKNSLGWGSNDRCPRCAECPRGCDLPGGCE